jgi:hypothetical protein
MPRYRRPITARSVPSVGATRMTSKACRTNTSLFQSQVERVGLVRGGVRWATAFGCWRGRFPATGIIGCRCHGTRSCGRSYRRVSPRSHPALRSRFVTTPPHRTAVGSVDTAERAE